MKLVYEIPGFSRYRVHMPFSIYDTQQQRYVAITTDKRRSLTHLYDDTGQRRAVSTIRLAALAFHGQPPVYEPHIQYHGGGDYTPTTVVWLPKREAYRLWRSALTPGQQIKVLALWEDGMTQDAIAKRFNVSQSTIARIVNRRFHNTKEVVSK